MVRLTRLRRLFRPSRPSQSERPFRLATPKRGARPRTGVLAALGVVLLSAGAGLAGEPDSTGRVLPDAVKKIVWSKVCDLPGQSYEVDCTANTDPGKCRFRRSNGDKFEPAPNDYGRAYSTARFSGPATVLEPGLREAKILGDQTDDGDFTSFIFKLASGLDLRVGDPEDGLYHLNPAAVVWFERELLPAPSEPMCGVTAGEMYAAAFQRNVRASAVAYEYLRRGGHLKKVDRARLERERGERKGGYWRVCETLEKSPAHKPFPERMLVDECQFWLRRGASSALPELSVFLGDLVQRFDTKFYREHAMTFAPK